MRALSGGNRRLAWLGLTPDPERLLPGQVARLRHAAALGTSEASRAADASQASDAARASRAGDASQAAQADLERAERRRIEQLILHGTSRRWLRYLGELTDLVVAVADGKSPGDPRTAHEVAEVVSHHHRMLIGLPGPGYELAAGQRAALDTALSRLESR
ncbi:hypothetical protein [Paractinoplanes globisporus]|uniref:Uncharacterized protein n=1 Tax=Paractinoplanes globisporus TaxID=113565 RepID=A0ABW6W954_9ACTN|nr:hypothetical protein [Actinoplanes globisporus]